MILITRHTGILCLLLLAACGEARRDQTESQPEPTVDAARGQQILESIKSGEEVRVRQMVENEPSLLYAKDSFGWRPLHLAVRYKRTELVPFLISKGANVNHQDGSGMTPLMWAIEYERPDFVEALLRAGADPNIREDSQDWGPLHMACYYSLPQAVKLLLDGGADVNYVDDTGRSPLLWALTPVSHDNRLEVLSLLLEHGADVDVTSKDGSTPVQIVEHRGGENASALVDLLKKHGAE